MKQRSRSLNDLFVDAADKVSYAIGTPANIGLWFVALVVWTVMGPTISHDNFLPAWFTSNSWNFPLNTVTTILELFIGYLIAASNNRQERNSKLVLHHIGVTTDESLGDERQILQLLASLDQRLARIEQQSAPADA